MTERNIRNGKILWGVMVVVAALVGCDGKTVQLQIAPTQAYIDARSKLLQAAGDRNGGTRMHAVEAIAETLGADEGGVYLQALRDENPAVRFAAAMAIGDVEYEPARGTLLRMAKFKTTEQGGEPDRRVFCAVIYALYRLGNDAYAGALGDLLFDKEKQVRGDAVMVMGRMGEPSGIGPLQTLYGDEQDEGLKLQIVGALAMLGEARYARLLEAYTKTQFEDDRLVAISAIQRAGTPRATAVLEDMLVGQQPARVRVAAAGGMARLGEVSAYGEALCLRAVRSPRSLLTREELAEKPAEKVTVRIKSLQALAAISLGWMKRESAVKVLHPLLEDPDGPVRVTAAMSILRILSGYRTAAPAAALPAPGPTSRTVAPRTRPGQGPRKLFTSGAKD